MLTKEQVGNLKPGDVVYVDYPETWDKFKKACTNHGIAVNVEESRYDYAKREYGGKSYIVASIESYNNNFLIHTKCCSYFYNVFLSLPNNTAVKQEDHSGMIWNEYTKTWSWF